MFGLSWALDIFNMFNTIGMLVTFYMVNFINVLNDIRMLNVRMFIIGDMLGNITVDSNSFNGPYAVRPCDVVLKFLNGFVGQLKAEN